MDSSSTSGRLQHGSKNPVATEPTSALTPPATTYDNAAPQPPLCAPHSDHSGLLADTAASHVPVRSDGSLLGHPVLADGLKTKSVDFSPLMMAHDSRDGCAVSAEVMMQERKNAQTSRQICEFADFRHPDEQATIFV